jgi:eukaryotic-like serine/threonine-protein kinase
MAVAGADPRGTAAAGGDLGAMGVVMNLGHYRLLAQLGAASDGVAYRAIDERGGDAVEVRSLGEARADADRWPVLVKRLRLAGMVDHPAAQRVRELRLEDDPPLVALEWVEGEDLAGSLRERVPLPESEAVALAGALAGALWAAHRLGLCHGRLGASSLLGTGPHDLKVDLTGLETRPAPGRGPIADLDAACRAPRRREGMPPDSTDDVFSLGALLSWWLTGRRDADAPAAGPLGALIREMLAPDPDDRPSARVVSERLAGLTPASSSGSGGFAETIDTIMAPSGSSAERSAAAAQAALETIDSAPAALAAGPQGTSGRAGVLERPVLGDAADLVATRRQLGRFRLLERVGQGGMGAVYRARDVADGAEVAIKVLRADYARRPDALRRFHKEARLLAEVNHPHVTNLIEVNEDDGLHYLALEFVAGRDLGSVLDEHGRLDEPTALAIMADVARALAVAHERGIVHRDVKPDNILLVESGPAEAPPPADLLATLVTTASTIAAGPPARVLQVKLSDFGLARHVVESESLMVTQAEAVVGTPTYMAPEQGTGGTVDARSDVYAMGATLFRLLAGRPPFLSSRLLDLIAMHQNDPVPPLQKFNPALSDGVNQVVQKALAKSPDARYPDAGAMLHDLERLLRGEPTAVAVHPKLPEHDPRDVLSFDFRWELEAAPRQLWPHVANTDRLNHAVGLPPARYTTRPDGARGVRRDGEAKFGPLPAAWQEHPFEWVEPRRYGVLRIFTKGPFKWFVSVLEMTPRAGGGTTLHHKVYLEPQSKLMRPMISLQMNGATRRALDRVYRRIDAALTGKLGERPIDPFEEAPPLSGARRRRLDQLLDVLVDRGVDPGVAERLGDFLARGPSQEVSRIRPLALARRLGLDPDQVVSACLIGAREGLLVLLWDLLCPVCRIPSEVKDTLRLLKEHGRCEACNLDFELDFASSVELIFRAHPEVREADTATYCVGGPAHSPHVVAQVRVAPGERVELDLALPEGTYRLRGPQLPYTIDLRVQPSAAERRATLSLTAGPAPDFPRALRAGGQVIALSNDFAHEVVVRVERTAGRDDALTAARASSLALFRELFPGEVLTPGQLASVANVTLLATDLEGAADLYMELGDARAFAVIHEHLRRLDERIRREGGAVIKTLGEGVLAAFDQSAAAVRVGLDLHAPPEPGPGSSDLRLRVAIHRGPAMVTTLNDHLDYFGATVNQAAQLLRHARGGDLILTQPVASDPAVAEWLAERSLEGEILPADLPGLPGGLVHRLSIPEPAMGRS